MSNKPINDPTPDLINAAKRIKDRTNAETVQIVITRTPPGDTKADAREAFAAGTGSVLEREAAVRKWSQQ